MKNSYSKSQLINLETKTLIDYFLGKQKNPIKKENFINSLQNNGKTYFDGHGHKISYNKKNKVYEISYVNELDEKNKNYIGLDPKAKGLIRMNISDETRSKIEDYLLQGYKIENNGKKIFFTEEFKTKKSIVEEVINKESPNDQILSYIKLTKDGQSDKKIVTGIAFNNKPIKSTDWVKTNLESYSKYINKHDTYKHYVETIYDEYNKEYGKKIAEQVIRSNYLDNMDEKNKIDFAISVSNANGLQELPNIKDWNDKISYNRRFVLMNKNILSFLQNKNMVVDKKRNLTLENLLMSNSKNDINRGIIEIASKSDISLKELFSISNFVYDLDCFRNYKKVKNLTEEEKITLLAEMKKNKIALNYPEHLGLNEISRKTIGNLENNIATNIFKLRDFIKDCKYPSNSFIISSKAALNTILESGTKQDLSKILRDKDGKPCNLNKAEIILNESKKYYAENKNLPFNIFSRNSTIAQLGVIDYNNNLDAAQKRKLDKKMLKAIMQNKTNVYGYRNKTLYDVILNKSYSDIDNILSSEYPGYIAGKVVQRDFLRNLVDGLDKDVYSDLQDSLNSLNKTNPDKFSLVVNKSNMSSAYTYKNVIEPIKDSFISLRSCAIKDNYFRKRKDNFKNELNEKDKNIVSSIEKEMDRYNRIINDEKKKSISDIDKIIENISEYSFSNESLKLLNMKGLYNKLNNYNKVDILKVSEKGFKEVNSAISSLGNDIDKKTKEIFPVFQDKPKALTEYDIRHSIRDLKDVLDENSKGDKTILAKHILVFRGSNLANFGISKKEEKTLNNIINSLTRRMGINEADFNRCVQQSYSGKNSLSKEVVTIEEINKIKSIYKDGKTINNAKKFLEQNRNNINNTIKKLNISKNEKTKEISKEKDCSSSSDDWR